jgi:drug/metabolite transporter (DMT)-like permease
MAADSRRPDGADARVLAISSWQVLAWMLGLTALWGLNAVSIKVLTQDVAPIMSLALRGTVAIVPLTLYGLWRGESFRFRGWPAVHQGVNALLFTVEFIAIYAGARYTTGGHVSIFLNTAPFFTALGAHLLLVGDRLHTVKALGLGLAFAGVLTLFSEDLFVQRAGIWRGDLLVLLGAVCWAGGTLYIKRFLVQHYSGFQLLYVPVVVSTPLFWLASWLLEPVPFHHVTWLTVAIIVFQALVIVNFSYLAFLVILRVYPASSMHAWTFLSPVWGVLAGVLLLGEHLTPFLLLGIVAVGLGLRLINRPPRAAHHAAG